MVSFLTRFLAQLYRRTGGLLLALLLSSLVSLAQTNLFVPHDDSNQVPQNTSKSGNVLINDDNPQNLPNAAFVVTLVTPPTHGTVDLYTDGSYTYTPVKGYAGADSFTYRICQAGATPPCTATTAAVALNVYDANVVCTLGTGPNLIYNPSFTLNNTGFGSSYTYVQTPSSTPNLYKEGTYAITGNSNLYHSDFHTTGRTGANDNCLVFNGAASLGIVYSQTVTVQPDTYYFLSAYGASANGGSPAQLGLVVNGRSTSVVTTLPSAPNQYVPFSDVYYSGPGPAGGFPVTFEIRDINKAAQGNDFTLDDLYFGSCSTLLRAETKTTTAVLNAPIPTTILPLSATIATGGSAGITVASFTVQTLPATGILYYNGFAVTAGQVIPVSGAGSLSSGGTLIYVPAPGCPIGNVTFTYIATDTNGSPSNNTATYTIPVQAYTVTPGTIGADQTICPGSTLAPLTSLAGASGGLGTYTYQWEVSLNNSTWTQVPGATSATYAPGPATTLTYYRRRATSGACATDVSNVVTITVQPTTVVPGTIGANQTLCASTVPATLTSLAGASGAYTYQWESSADNSSWAPITDAASATYAPGALGSTTYYRRRVTLGACATAVTNVVTITVQPVTTPGGIGTDQTLCVGSTPAPLASTAASGGTGTYAYQWESSVNNSNWAAVAGATSAAYAPGVLSTTTYYRLRVTSGVCASVVTNVVTITVRPLLTPVVQLTIPPAQCAGLPFTFTPVATNAGPTPAYQWLVNGTQVATTPTYTGSTLANGDLVKVVVTPAAGVCATGSATATVTISLTPVVQPTLAIAAQTALPVCVGTPITFALTSATNAGTSPQYQWQVDGADVPGATSTTFTSATLRDGQAVTLVLHTTSCVPLVATSNKVKMGIAPPVTVSAGPDVAVMEGESVLLQGETNGSNPTWTPNQSLTFTGPDVLHPQATPTVTTVYTLSAGSGTCTGRSSVTVTVTPRLRIPNAFTPNGDGNDDTWQIANLSAYPLSHVTIFNRWGSKLFETADYGPGNEWNGSIKGQPAPVGTYYYLLALPNGKHYSGSLTVLY